MPPPSSPSLPWDQLASHPAPSRRRSPAKAYTSVPCLSKAPAAPSGLQGHCGPPGGPLALGGGGRALRSSSLLLQAPLLHSALRAPHPLAPRPQSPRQWLRPSFLAWGGPSEAWAPALGKPAFSKGKNQCLRKKLPKPKSQNRGQEVAPLPRIPLPGNPSTGPGPQPYAQDRQCRL